MIRRTTAVLLLLLCLGMPALAHHIRGIPHYSYQENYPQAPLYEEFRDVGPWTMQFTFWSIPSQKALDLALYVKNRHNDVPYEGSVSFRVYRHGEKTNPEAEHTFTATANARNIYKVGWVYEDDGVYYAEVNFIEGDEAVSETFRFQVGKVKPNYMLLAGIAGGLLALMVLVAVIKRRTSPAPA